MKEIIERYAFSIFLGLLAGIIIIYAGLHYEYKFMEFQLKSLMLPIDVDLTQKKTELTEEPKDIPVYEFKDVFKKIDLIHETDASAKKALMKFIRKDKDNLQEAMQLDSNLIFAAFVDLDDDGVDEVIGAMDYVQNLQFMANELFILKKTKDGYERIHGPYVTIFRPISILNSKTKNFKDIGFQGSSVWKYRPDVAIMHENVYVRKNHNVLISDEEQAKKVRSSIEFKGLNNGDNEANKKLFNHITKEFPQSKEKVTLHDMEAYFIDLNNDGKNEIIGTTYSKFFNGRKTSAFFVLQEKDGKYQNLTLNSKDGKRNLKQYAWGHPIEIMVDKANGFNNLRYYELIPSVPSPDSPVVPITLKIENGSYK